ncbi:hypothetical protein [Nocardia sp. CA-290969]|uniref:hypothetical protein n=1 Tax=Nocardia sp. CA-290969 TaxID=3239986 RepID=UPI003D8ABE36
MKTTALAAPAMILAALTATGCGANPATDHSRTAEGCAAARFTAPYEQIDPCSAELVLQAAVAATFRYRPADDPDPRAAFARARPVVQDRFAEQADPAAAVWAPITTSQWQRWRDQQTPVTTTVHITGDDHPPDTAATTDRVLAVRIQPAHEPAVAFTVYANATRSPCGPWLLSGLGVQS